jgi:hypothetical protein
MLNKKLLPININIKIINSCNIIENSLNLLKVIYTNKEIFEKRSIDILSNIISE